jgi:hypothetical protein
MPCSAHIGVYLIHAVSCRWWTRETYFPAIPHTTVLLLNVLMYNTDTAHLSHNIWGK